MKKIKKIKIEDKLLTISVESTGERLNLVAEVDQCSAVVGFNKCKLCGDYTTSDRELCNKCQEVIETYNKMKKETKHSLRVIRRRFTEELKQKEKISAKRVGCNTPVFRNKDIDTKNVGIKIKNIDGYNIKYLKNDKATYLVSLVLSGCNTDTLISLRTGVKPQSVYRYMQNLQNAGLVQRVRRRDTKFYIVPETVEIIKL